MSAHAFVSYSRTDAAYVGQLISWFADRGVPVWSDAGIDYGSQWPAVVRDAVDRSAVVIVVMSPAAEASEWVDRELARAELKGRPVLPLLLEGDPFFRLGSTHYEDVRGGLLPGDGFVGRVVALCEGMNLEVSPYGSPIMIRDGPGDVYERTEPLEAQLATLLRSLTTRSDDPFFILDRPDHPGYFAQVVVVEEFGFQVEYCDGGPENHYAALTDDVDVAANVLAGWADGVDGWGSQLEWELVRPY